MYIIIEGIDGSGKSTYSKMLADHLGAVHVVEPSSLGIGQLIRQRIRDNQLNPDVMARLFAADRHDLADKVIRPALLEGRTVVSDRSLISSLVYQTGDRLTVPDVWDINVRGRSLPRPDVAVVIDIPAEEAVRRIIESRGGTDAFEDKLEEYRTRYQEIGGFIDWPVISTRYQEIGGFIDWPVISINGNSDRESVFKTICSAVERYNPKAQAAAPSPKNFEKEE